MALKQKEFKVLEVPLKGTNLVEASAGTGKTYSIAIIALRLIIENGINISEILMVTYTKAAVAELDQRIRIFIKKATSVVDEEEIDDQTITKYVTEAIDKYGKQIVKGRLDTARLLMDETSILTIHGFCQQVLQEFSFETGSLFGMNLVTSIKDIITQEVQIFWRKHISGLPIDFFPFMESVTVEMLSNTVAMQLSGRQYAGYVEGRDYVMDNNLLDDVRMEAIRLEKEAEAIVAKQLEILSNYDVINARIQSNGFTKKNLTDVADEPSAILEFILANDDKAYVKKVFPDIMALMKESDQIKEALNSISKKLQHTLVSKALQYIIPAVQASKKKLNVVGFDDLITEVHQALVVNNNKALINLLQEKYKAVFVDEFQDTDLKQYEIFKTAFASTSIMFYIGDPKQSIYKFRSADIFTYLQARKEVDVIYTMNINYRSSLHYIMAANKFLKPQPEFDTFHFQGMDDGIDYINVDAASDHAQQLLHGEDALPAIIVSEVKNKNENLYAIVSCAAMLLNGEHFLTGNEEKRPVVPSDIGILVSSNHTAREISVALSARDIPSVLVSDAKIFGSDELRFIFEVLHAISEPSSNTINKALLGKFTGITEEELPFLNHEILLPLFTSLNDRWMTQGVYSAIKEFLLQFNIEARLIGDQSTVADRSITNLQQVTELLYKAERVNNLQPKELLQWLQRMMEEEGEGDEYLQRIESEEDAVKISTVHKSKGLEYNIVIAPNLDYNLKIRGSHVQFKDPITRQYISKHKDWLSPEELNIYNLETEQEYRRLLYVAVTRTVYCSFIIRNTYYKSSTLSSFLNAVTGEDEYKIDDGYFDNDERYKPLQEQKKFTANPVAINVSENNWYKLSYSALSAELNTVPKKRGMNLEDNYENFIFNNLSLGAETGNLVHLLFEKISFSNREYWNDSVAKIILANRAKDEELIPNYLLLLSNVLDATIIAGDSSFQLSQINSQQKIHELEFYFPLANLNMDEITGFFTDNGVTIFLRNMSAIRGMMQGFVDLLFYHDDKYYILDWKTTYLGSNLDDYNQASVSEAMEEHNYHLQYMIYCVAVSKYLASRKTDFDYDKDFGGVIYGFVRGMRCGQQSGIFFKKPDKAFVHGLAEKLNNLPQ